MLARWTGFATTCAVCALAWVTGCAETPQTPASHVVSRLEGTVAHYAAGPGAIADFDAGTWSTGEIAADGSFWIDMHAPTGPTAYPPTTVADVLDRTDPACRTEVLHGDEPLRVVRLWTVATAATDGYLAYGDVGTTQGGAEGTVNMLLHVEAAATARTLGPCSVDDPGSVFDGKELVVDLALEPGWNAMHMTHAGTIVRYISGFDLQQEWVFEAY